MKEFDIARDAIRSKMDFLSRWGFEYESERLQSSKHFGEELSIVYTSHSLARSIDVDYRLPPNANAAVMSLYIRLRTNQQFSLYEFLSEAGRKEECNLFVNMGHAKPVKKFCEDFLAMAGNVIENDLAGLLCNESWSVKPYDWRDEY